MVEGTVTKWVETFGLYLEPHLFTILSAGKILPGRDEAGSLFSYDKGDIFDIKIMFSLYVFWFA